MARCSWLIFIGLIFLFSSAVASESLSNGTRTTGNVTAQRDGREYDVHPAPGSTNNERLEVAVQSLSPRPKSLGTGTWKAIKIWNDPVEATSSSSTAKRASSPERVVASSASRATTNSTILITFLFLPALMLFLTRLIDELSISHK
uniref:Uncharacterized protein n=1 Tax=Daphnia galeata TaxID=27404 RepID=A0A8J2S5B3_9CRUS|nr:unnamed protein product [Daphnia galeata]